ncbi:MAG: hypothetical protein K9N47_16345 [Prosthecobacter sp.]|uniref:hypothetical protein n=1 Tax=Prosthecobacter sp. TaxID=1965333 RepID=UPI0025F4AAE7|nr:hypothetical protein [Prosthecobacter sp.]MCF7787701.1 hypothetical protein [Prosthecobacter sp.]
MSQNSCLSVLFPCLLGLLATTLCLPAAGENHGMVQVSARVWELDSALPLKEIAPLASHFPPHPPTLQQVPSPQPMLPGMMTLPVILPTSEALKTLRALETEFAAKNHPLDSKTVPVGATVTFTIPFAAEKLEMHVLTALKCRLYDEIDLLVSFPDPSRVVNPLLKIQARTWSSEDASCLLCRTEAKGDVLHHTLILLEEIHYGIPGKDAVTLTRDKLQRLKLPETLIDARTSLETLEWLVAQSRELDKKSKGSSGHGINVVWLRETAEDVRHTSSGASVSLFIEKGMTLRNALMYLTELSQMSQGIEDHALVFHVISSDNECSPGEFRRRLFQVKPQFLTRFQDNAAINAAARSSNIPFYDGSGFTLDRKRLTLACRQPPEHFILAEKWLTDQRLLDEPPQPAAPLPAALAKAGKIILPQLDLRRASLSEAVKAIQEAAAKADPPVRNLKISITPGSMEETLITLFTHGLPADEALKHCARLSGHRIEADDTTITLHPRT